MKIHIENCGAIGTGTVDLAKQVTLLCGENGTGKTYFSYLIYGLLKNRFHVKTDDKIIEQLINEKEVTFEIDYKKIVDYRKIMLDNTKISVDSIFGISSEDAKKLFDDLTINFEDIDNDVKKGLFEADIVRTERIQSLNSQLTKPKGTNSVTLKILNKDISSDAFIALNLLLFSFVYYTLAVYPLSGVEVFPVERNSIYTVSKELSIRKQEALDNLQMLIDKDKKVSKLDLYFNSKRYPWPIRDGLMVAEDLVERKKSKSQFYDFAENLENELLHGRVQISNDGEIQFKPLKSLRTILPIQMTASIVKTLSSLVVYLKYIAKENDLIIIDEPEINLHPNNQIIIARILVRLANKGFRILVSTHSDYIIREFNNMVMLSQLKNKREVASKMNYLEEEFLEPKNLGVYVFKYKTKRSKKIEVCPVEVSDTGFSIPSIDDTIEIQNQHAEDLFYLLKYSTNENSEM